LQQGNIHNSTHLRSCAKPFQLLPLFEIGVFSEEQPFQGLKPEDLALMMSSHGGQKIHTSRVAELLSLLGLTSSALRCGIHPPQDHETSCELLAQQKNPTALHHNCSGKHAAMLIACIKQGLDLNSYEDINHPLQQQILRLLAPIADLSPKDIAYGIDGCSLPSFVMPLKNLGLMYARLAWWQKSLPKNQLSFLSFAFEKIWASATAHPEYLAGDHRFDTLLIKACDHTIFSKTGADGLQAISILPSPRFPYGLGIIVKIADGDPKSLIRPLVIKTILEHFGLTPPKLSWEKFLPKTSNFRGLKTSTVSCRI
jgi:L-asparaginase II